MGDLEEPLRQLFLFDQRARPPAAAIDDLLVGEDRVIHRVPVHLAFFAIDKTRFVESLKQPLLLVIVVRIAGREFARPIERQADALQLRAHHLDILVGPFARIDLLLHGRVFGGQAEGIPAEGMQHAEALRPLVARDDIAHHVVAHVPDMDAPRRIGKHLKHIVFRLVAIRGGEKSLLLLPNLLPMFFALGRVVAFQCHDRCPARKARQRGLRDMKVKGSAGQEKLAI